MNSHHAHQSIKCRHDYLEHHLRPCLHYVYVTGIAESLLERHFGFIKSNHVDSSICSEQLQLNEAEHYSRCHQFCSHSRTSQHFMEPEGSLPYSQELSTSPYAEPDQHNESPTPCPIFPRSILILSTNLRFLPIHATCCTHSILLHLVGLIIQDVSKRSLQWYSKCYCVASVSKTFTLKGVQTVYQSRC
jgi:hypothetical protein